MRNERDQYAIKMTAMNDGIAIGEAMGRNEVFSLLETGMSLEEAKKKLGLQTQK